MAKVWPAERAEAGTTVSTLADRHQTVRGSVREPAPERRQIACRVPVVVAWRASRRLVPTGEVPR